MRVVVIGLGATGDAVVADARAAGHAVSVVEDVAEGPAYSARAARADALGAEVVEVPSFPTMQALATAAELVVPSPGVRPDHPVIAAAVAAGVPVRSEVDLAVERIRARDPRPRLVAVTGTNGKTTVTTMIAAMCEQAGFRSLAVGNIGPPILAAAGEPADVVVAEVSTFQLEFTTNEFVPDLAVLLNVAKDHIDWHDTVEAYAAAKARIFAHQREDDVLVVNADDPVAWHLAQAAPSRLVPYSVHDAVEARYGVRDGFLAGPGGKIAPEPATRVAHEVSNALAATAAAAELGVDATAIGRTLSEWRGLPHRVQFVAEVAGVQFVDDSKATNGHAAASALEGFEHVVLIAGGRDRSRDLGLLRKHAPKVRAVVAIGESAATVEDVFRGFAPVERAASMHEAVRAAAARAAAGDTVLLSPGCASLDWYENYAARGDDFAREVELLSRDVQSSPMENGT